MGLSTYNKKRDFKITAEPPGRRPKTKAGHHFYIQKHDASHLHFDFRLELDGVLKSWAVPKGPSVTPGVRRLAVEVEDHPIDYGNFEGTIPEGEYGGGTVMLWDRGTWQPEVDNVRQALKAGKIKFRLEGERLNGTWSLVRSGPKENGKPLWFLIKNNDLSRKLSSEPVEVAKTSVLSARTMDEIAQGKTKKSRGSVKVIKNNKSKKKDRRALNLPKNFSPQLATLVDSPPQGEEWIHEIKFDGYRIVAVIENDEVRLFSRNGHDWTAKLHGIAGAISKMELGNAIIDGELTAPDKEGRTDFQVLQNAIKNDKDQQMVYYVFDVLNYQGEDLRSQPLLERKEVLANIFQNEDIKKLPVRKSDFVRGNGQKVYDEAARLGLEGIVSKNINSTYSFGRSEDWVKTKSLLRQEFVVVGFSEPKGARSHLGALLLAAYDNDGKLQYVGRTGTGFDVEKLSSLKKKLDKLALTKDPGIYDPYKEIGNRREITWVKPKLIAETKFATWTQHKILRQAVYLGLRSDKSPSEVKLDQPKPVEEITPHQKKIKNKENETAGISKAEKILFSPDITKGELAEYYRSIADWILPHIVNRPLSIVRCPDGHDKMCFFQKHAAASRFKNEESDLIHEGKTKEFMYVDSIEGVIALIQLGVLEIHGWGTHVEHFEKPDQIVFDLDADPGTPWEKIVETALRIRDRLKLLKLKSFVKTTGGKGLHIVTPIEPNLDWNEVKSFCKSFANALEQEFPKDYTAEMSKVKRKNKIFIDYLRNGRGATAVLPYSTRAKAHAPVSTPLTWEELDSTTSADHYTIRNLQQRLKKIKKDPWAGFFKLRQPLNFK